MKFKKVIGMLLAGVMLMSTVPVFAEPNTSDKPYTVWTSDGGYEKKIPVRYKTNTTKVYTRVDSSPQYTMQVRVYGYLNGQYINKTKDGYAYVDRGTNSSITNFIYEAGSARHLLHSGVREEKIITAMHREYGARIVLRITRL